MTAQEVSGWSSDMTLDEKCAWMREEQARKRRKPQVRKTNKLFNPYGGLKQMATAALMQEVVPAAVLDPARAAADLRPVSLDVPIGVTQHDELREPRAEPVRCGLPRVHRRVPLPLPPSVRVPVVQRVRPELWDGIAAANARSSCRRCTGIGFRTGRGGREVVCNCVLRGVFRACLRRYRNCSMKLPQLAHVSYTCSFGRDRRRMYELKNQDFIADFYLVSRRTLANDPTLWQIFDLHHLQGHDWKICCRQIRIDRGTFFHAVYRLEERLGRVFRELRPYGLYPLDEYFAGYLRKDHDDQVSGLAGQVRAVPA